jgi:tetratricopeptide (TPR) repeat protein
VKLDADSAETRFHRALVYLDSDKLEDAVADYREVIRLEPHDAEVYKKWDVNPETIGGQSNVQRLEKALAKHQDEAKEHYVKAVDLHKEGKLVEAIAEYDKAVLLYPRCPEVHYNRGLAYRGHGDLEMAAVDFTQAIDLDPKFTGAYSNRGYVNFKLGDYAEALADFKKVLEIDPQNADARKSIEVIEKTQKQGDSQ